MGSYVSNETIRALRTAQELTQEQLAQQVGVTAKAVSKWETGRGLPDASLLEPLAAALGVSLAELITGDVSVNENRSGNIKNSQLYLCPICGNVVWSMGGITASCCGVSLLPLEAEKGDDDHQLRIETIDGEHVVTVEHPMEKSHFVSFIAAINDNEVRLTKLYPQQDALARFAIRPGVRYFACCNRHGLFCALPPRRAKSILEMDDAQWKTEEQLDHAIVEMLKLALNDDPAGELGKRIAELHRRWMISRTDDGDYTAEAHLNMAYTYLSSPRYMSFYDDRAGDGATLFLVSAVGRHCLG